MVRASWLALILAFLALGVIIHLFRKLAGANKIILAIALCVISGVVGFNWIYNRNEPPALTPLVDILAQFFPTKGSYEGKQQQDPANPGIRKNAPASKPSPTGTNPNSSSSQPPKK